MLFLMVAKKKAEMERKSQGVPLRVEKAIEYYNAYTID